MTEEMTPWARAAAERAAAEQPAPAVNGTPQASLSEPATAAAEPAVEERPLFGGADPAEAGDQPLFGAGPARPRQARELPVDAGSTGRRVASAVGAGPAVAGPPPGRTPPPLRTATGSAAGVAPGAPAAQAAAVPTPQATAPASAGAPPAGRKGGIGRDAVLVGTLNGGLKTETVYRRFPGIAVLVVVGLISLVVAVIGLAANLAIAGFYLIMLLLMLLVFGFVLSRFVPLAGVLLVRLVLEAGKLLVWLAMFAGHGLWRLMTGAANSGAVSATMGASPLQVRAFQVRLFTGESVDCVLYGEPAGALVKHGDPVRCAGRRGRDGRYRVRRIEVLAAPTGPVAHTVAARIPGAFQRRLWGNRLCYLLAVGIAAYGLVLLLR